MTSFTLLLRVAWFIACWVLILWLMIEKLCFFINYNHAKKSTKEEEGKSEKRINGIHYGKWQERRAGASRKSSW